MTSLRVHVDGDKELVTMLHRLGIQVADILEPAVEAAAEIVRADAAGREPDADVSQETAKRSEHLVQVDVGPGKKKWYYTFRETGAAPHTMAGHVMVFEGDEGLVMTGKVNHPGMNARPFLRPAMDTNEGAAEDAMGNYWKKAIDEVT